VHPFNPLQHLRLCIAAGSEPHAIARIFDDIWTTGADATDPTRFASLVKELEVPPEKLSGAEVKDALRKNTDEAAARGVFGVPSFVVDGEVFWGADSIEFLNAFLKDPAILMSAEMQRLDHLPVGAVRAR
jgi:2-hydroxychromene-2-carboxylate isomerase